MFQPRLPPGRPFSPRESPFATTPGFHAAPPMRTCSPTQLLCLHIHPVHSYLDATASPPQIMAI